MKTKQVIVVRKDLNMRRGKEISQGAHASLACFTKAIIENNHFTGKQYSIIPISEIQQEWLDNSYRKICVYVESEAELLEINRIASEAGLNVSLIKDSGLTEFKEPTYTCLCIGPHEDEKIDKITGHLPLY